MHRRHFRRSVGQLIHYMRRVPRKEIPSDAAHHVAYSQLDLTEEDGEAGEDATNAADIHQNDIIALQVERDNDNGCA